MARTLNWVTSPPAIAKKGRVITPAPEIEILADGVRENVTGPVTLSGSGLLGTLTQQAAEGLVAFPDLSFSQLGNIQVEAACDEANLVVPAPARPTTWRVNYLSGGNYDPLVGENVFWKTGSTSGSSSATFVWTVCIAKDASGFTVQAPGGSVDFVMGTTKTASGEPVDVSSVMAASQQSWAISPNGGGLTNVQPAFTPTAGSVIATDAPGLALDGADWWLQPSAATDNPAAGYAEFGATGGTAGVPALVVWDPVPSFATGGPLGLGYHDFAATSGHARTSGDVEGNNAALGALVDDAAGCTVDCLAYVGATGSGVLFMLLSIGNTYPCMVDASATAAGVSWRVYGTTWGSVPLAASSAQRLGWSLVKAYCNRDGRLVVWVNGVRLLEPARAAQSAYGSAKLCIGLAPISTSVGAVGRPFGLAQMRVRLGEPTDAEALEDARRCGVAP